MIKKFENYINELDPYGEENWDDNTIIGNLMVSPKLQGKYIWKKAMELCKNYSEGYDDWRLPTIGELDDIYKYNRKFNAFLNVDKTIFYWSSSEYLSTGEAYLQNFNSGCQYHCPKDVHFSVIAVRNI